MMGDIIAVLDADDDDDEDDESNVDDGAVSRRGPAVKSIVVIYVVVNA